MSFVARQALSVVRIPTRKAEVPENLPNFSLSVFRHGLLPGPLGSCHPPPSSGKVNSLPPRIYRRGPDTQLQRVDFVQEMYLKELKVYKPAPKVHTTRVTFILSTLTRGNLFHFRRSF